MDNFNVTFEVDGIKHSYSIVSGRGCVGMVYFVHGGSASSDALEGEFYSLGDAVSACRQDFEELVKLRAELPEEDEVIGSREGYYDDDTEGDPDDYYDDSMDGDHDSALASAGWGTDEDYSSFGGDEGW